MGFLEPVFGPAIRVFLGTAEHQLLHLPFVVFDHLVLSDLFPLHALQRFLGGIQAHDLVV